MARPIASAAGKVADNVSYSLDRRSATTAAVSRTGSARPFLRPRHRDLDETIRSRMNRIVAARNMSGIGFSVSVFAPSTQL